MMHMNSRIITATTSEQPPIHPTTHLNWQLRCTGPGGEPLACRTASSTVDST